MASTQGNECDQGDLVTFLDDKKHCDSARIDDLLFLVGHAGEPSCNWFDGYGFLGISDLQSEIGKGAVHFGFFAGVEGEEL
jgi:hypothetical protein